MREDGGGKGLLGHFLVSTTEEGASVQCNSRSKWLQVCTKTRKSRIDDLPVCKCVASIVPRAGLYQLIECFSLAFSVILHTLDNVNVKMAGHFNDNNHHLIYKKNDLLY